MPLRVKSYLQYILRAADSMVTKPHLSFGSRCMRAHGGVNFAITLINHSLFNVLSVLCLSGEHPNIDFLFTMEIVQVLREKLAMHLTNKLGFFRSERLKRGISSDTSNPSAKWMGNAIAETISGITNYFRSISETAAISLIGV